MNTKRFLSMGYLGEMNGRFVKSRYYDTFIASRRPLTLFLTIFTLAFLIQLVLCAIEGTLLPSPRITKPLVNHLTILVGGTLLIPSIFYQAARFYADSHKAFLQLQQESILTSESIQAVSKSWIVRREYVINALLIFIVLFIDCIQFGGANANINYVHVVNGRLTICGWYYAIIFIPLSYSILVLIIDMFSFANFVKSICVSMDLQPKIFHRDNQYGLSAIIHIGQRVSCIAGLIGFYFIVIFLNWNEYHSIKSLLLNFEEIMMLVGLFVLSPLLLISYYAPIKRFLSQYEDSILQNMLKAYDAYSLDPSSVSFRSNIGILRSDGFFDFQAHVIQHRSQLFEFKLLAQVYSFLLIPLFYPFFIGIIIEIISKKFIS